MMVIKTDVKNSGKKWKIATRTSVTVNGVANYCLVSESTVRRWIKDGKLAALRLPSGQYRVTLVDFRDFLKRFDIPIKDI